MDELACFVPGMLALGSSGYGPEDSKKFFTLAEEVLSKLLDVPRDLTNTSFSNFSQGIIFFKCHSYLPVSASGSNMQIYAYCFW